MEQDQQADNGLERRLNEMAAVVEEMRRQQTEMQSEMQRQAEMHEKERKRWHEECQKMQEERERLLKQGAEKPKPKIAGLLMSSRVIGGSKASGSHHGFLGNRTRNFHALPDGFKEKLLEVVRQKREQLASNLQKHRQAVETDQAARALDTLSISEQNKKSSPLPSPRPPSPPKSSNLQDQLKDSFETYQRHFEDFTKRRRMQQQLASVLHAQNCERNQVDALGYMTCGMPFCSVTSKVLEHMRTCTFVTKCPIPMCSLTREVLDHYKNCTTDGCQICQPAKQQSISTQEHLLKFMDSICKGLDEEASVETPSVPHVVLPPVNPILYPDITGMPSLPRIIPPLLPTGTTTFIPMEVPRVLNFDGPPSMINPIGGLFPQISGPMFLPTSIFPLPSMSFVTSNMGAQTEETSAETKMEGSDAQG